MDDQIKEKLEENGFEIVEEVDGKILVRDRRSVVKAHTLATMLAATPSIANIPMEILQKATAGNVPNSPGLPEGTLRPKRPKVPRNAPCPCGSGKKAKKCHPYGV